MARGTVQDVSLHTRATGTAHRRVLTLLCHLNKVTSLAPMGKRS